MQINKPPIAKTPSQKIQDELVDTLYRFVKTSLVGHAVFAMLSTLALWGYGRV